MTPGRPPRLRPGWRLQPRFWRSDIDSDVDDELRFHLEARIEALTAEGRSLEAARAQALVEFGDVERVRRVLRGIDRRVERARRRSGWLSSLAQDLRYAARTLVRSPGFSLAAITTLALGVGLNAVVFGAIDTVLLRPLPYGEPERLVGLWEETNRAGGYASGSVSRANLVDVQRQSQVFSGIAGFRLSPQNLTGNGLPERVWVEQATANYFSVLDVRPALGRAFTPDESTAGRERVVVLSDGLWRRLGSPASVLGSAIRLDDVEYEVIGVLPGSFRSPHEFNRLEPVAVYVPLVFSAKDLSPDGHGNHDLDAVARLNPGVTLASAQPDLDRISAWLAKTYPDTNATKSARIAFLHDVITRGVRTSLLVLLGAVGLVWLVASVNLANLLLVRALGRQREVTVRAALGASRLRLVQGLVTQSLLLSTCGCLAGLGIGWQLAAILRRIAPPGIPRLDALGIDLRVFAVMAALSTAAGVLFGLLPALHLSRTPLSNALRARSSSPSAPIVVRWRSALVVAEIALSLVLLTASGLLLRSFMTVSRVDLGFSTERVLTLNISLPASRYATPDDRLRFFEALTDRVRSIPGVQATGFANRFPMRGGWSGSMFFDGSREPIEVNLQAVSPDYFSTLGIPLLQGRVFEPADRSGSLPVVVINSALARAFFRGRDPLSQVVRRNLETAPVTVVGVVGDIRRAGKTAEIVPEMYFSAAQTDMYPVTLADFAVRARSNPRELVPAIREAVRSIDKDQPVGNVRTLREIVSSSVAQRRFEMLLIVLFAGVALVLTLVGIYGVVSFAVGQRTHEFGVRAALGARRSDILGMVLRQAAMLILLGLTIGLAGAYVVGQLLKTLLFETPPDDPSTFAAVSVMLAVVALLASLVPALRAATIDPVSALRTDQ